MDKGLLSPCSRIKTMCARISPKIITGMTAMWIVRSAVKFAGLNRLKKNGWTKSISSECMDTNCDSQSPRASRPKRFSPMANMKMERPSHQLKMRKWSGEPPVGTEQSKHDAASSQEDKHQEGQPAHGVPVGLGIERHDLAE